MPKSDSAAGVVNASVAEAVRKAFDEWSDAGATKRDRCQFIASKFEACKDWEEKEALKQETFVKPRLDRGVTQDSVNTMWSQFLKDIVAYEFPFTRWTINTPGAVKKRKGRETANAKKSEEILKLEEALKAKKEEAAAEAKAKAAELKSVKDKLAEVLKSMGIQELRKVLHFAEKLTA